MSQTTASATTSNDPCLINVRPLSGYTGAEIFGVDLRDPLTAPVISEIRATLVKWKVVFFRDQHLSQEQHLSFARQFGRPTPAHPTLPAAFPEFPEILLLDNLAFAGKESSGGPMVESRWHTDVTFVADPPMASILRGVVVPPYGGDTQFTNLVVAYERLSEPIRRCIDELHAVHQNFLPLVRGELPSNLAKQFTGRTIRAVHPMVRVHPETGEKTLFVNPNFTSHIVELTRREGAHLLELLYEHMINAEFTCRFRWEQGSIAFWDNRATAHLVPTDVVAGQHRSMQRITLAGEPARSASGSTSYLLSD